MQQTVQDFAQRPGAGARPPDAHQESKSFIGNNMAPEGLTNKTGFKQWSRRYKLVAGGEDERFKVLLEWAEARETNAAIIIPESSNVVGAPRLAQHVYASLIMSTKAGTETDSIVNNTPGDNGREAWRRLVQRLDPPNGTIDTVSFLIKECEGMLRRYRPTGP